MAEQQQQQRQQQETDIEALQAQIDLSNSVAFDIVSSWMKPSSSKTTAAATSTKTSSSTVARDFEEFARRPPRLGLGATVSKSTTAAIQETARLKGKLSKKPVRGGDDETLISDGKKNEDDEDEDSRNTAIGSHSHKPAAGSSKRAIVDVFAPRNKKRKRSNSLTEASSTVANARAVEEEVSSSSARLSPSMNKKRKGKGKNKAVGEAAGAMESSTTSDQIQQLFEEEWTGFSEDVLNSIQTNTDTVAAPPPPSSPSLSSSSSPSLQTKNHQRQAVSLSPISRRVFSPASNMSTTSTSALKTDDQIPLLNLHGPPSVLGAGPGTTSDAHGEKKRRKRRRAKKRKLELEQRKEG